MSIDDYDDYYFCEHAMARMFEYGLDPAEVLAAMAKPWVSQGSTRGRTEHYVKIEGGRRLLKVITAVQIPDDPRNDENIPADATVVITVVNPNGNGIAMNGDRRAA